MVVGLVVGRVVGEVVGTTVGRAVDDVVGATVGRVEEEAAVGATVGRVPGDVVDGAVEGTVGTTVGGGGPIVEVVVTGTGGMVTGLGDRHRRYRRHRRASFTSVEPDDSDRDSCTVVGRAVVGCDGGALPATTGAAGGEPPGSAPDWPVVAIRTSEATAMVARTGSGREVRDRSVVGIPVGTRTTAAR